MASHARTRSPPPRHGPADRLHSALVQAVKALQAIRGKGRAGKKGSDDTWRRWIEANFIDDRQDPGCRTTEQLLAFLGHHHAESSLLPTEAPAMEEAVQGLKLGFGIRDFRLVASHVVGFERRRSRLQDAGPEL